MDAFLYWGGSAALVLVVALMALCALAGIGWLPKPAARLAAPLPQRGGAPRRELLLWFFTALLYQWAVLFVAYCIVHGGAAGFLSSLWERFTTAGDSPHYIWLAENGYATEGEKLNLICFYPLYPALLRVLRLFTLGNTALAGMALSQLSFAGAAVMLRLLAGQTLPPAGARAATAALLLYPFSFFSFGVYTEGLYLFLSIGCLYFLGREEWLPAGALSFLAALCRTQGLALFFAAAFCFLRAGRAARATPKALALLGAPAGFGVYLLCNRVYAGSFGAFLAYQSAAPWYNTAAWYGDNLVLQYHMGLDYPGLAPFIYWPQLALYALGLLAIALVLLRRGDTALAIYSTAFFGMSYLHGWLISGGRYMFCCLALYYALGRCRRRWVRAVLLLLEGLLLLRFAVYYMQGQAIM